MSYGDSRIYKKIEIIGVSAGSVEDAIKAAVAKAHQTIEKISWFEVKEIRGHVDSSGAISEYQVVLKLAFQLN